jgi:hypothetical protein
MLLPITRNFDSETVQQREAQRRARLVQHDVRLVASALKNEDNQRADLDPLPGKVQVQDAYVREHEGFGYHHFKNLSGKLEHDGTQLQALEAKGNHQYEWLELDPPLCQPYQMGNFDVSYRREGQQEFYRSQGTSVAVNHSTGTLTITD